MKQFIFFILLYTHVLVSMDQSRYSERLVAPRVSLASLAVGGYQSFNFGASVAQMGRAFNLEQSSQGFNYFVSAMTNYYSSLCADTKSVAAPGFLAATHLVQAVMASKLIISGQTQNTTEDVVLASIHIINGLYQTRLCVYNGIEKIYAFVNKKSL